jgi:ribosomal protein S18 acetylase RimI-like enzyme
VTVQDAEVGDIRQWLRLAQEAKHLFGSIVTEHGFQAALRQSVQAGDALCVREGNDGPGAPLCGGILLSPNENRIHWLAVARRYRGCGIGTALVEAGMQRLDIDAPVYVTTFREDVPGAAGARALYRKFGFQSVAGESEADNPKRRTVELVRPPQARPPAF